MVIIVVVVTAQVRSMTLTYPVTQEKESLIVLIVTVIQATTNLSTQPSSLNPFTVNSTVKPPTVQLSITTPAKPVGCVTVTALNQPFTLPT